MHADLSAIRPAARPLLERLAGMVSFDDRVARCRPPANLFNRLLGVLHYCLHTGQTYNEAIAFSVIQSGASAHAA